VKTLAIFLRLAALVSCLGSISALAQPPLPSFKRSNSYSYSCGDQKLVLTACTRLILDPSDSTNLGYKQDFHQYEFQLKDQGTYHTYFLTAEIGSACQEKRDETWVFGKSVANLKSTADFIVKKDLRELIVLVNGRETKCTRDNKPIQRAPCRFYYIPNWSCADCGATDTPELKSRINSDGTTTKWQLCKRCGIKHARGAKAQNKRSKRPAAAGPLEEDNTESDIPTHPEKLQNTRTNNPMDIKFITD
jgi:hypothetical protein